MHPPKQPFNMLVHHIRVKSVNVHCNNSRIHTLLHKDHKISILLIQEPWYRTVATLHSDTDPAGLPQLGAPINPQWEVFTPKLTPEGSCKVLAYIRKALINTRIVHNHLDHPLATPNSMVLDIVDVTVLLRYWTAYVVRTN